MRPARRETEQLAAIIRGTADAVIGKASDGTITSWNAGAERLYGYSADEVIGKSIDIIIPLDRHGEERRILDQVGATRRSCRTTRAGSARTVRLSMCP
jgi:PAS domain S-box-containing protein